MKRFIAAALITLIAPAAMAESCIVNYYDRHFIIYGDATLPPLKILSVAPGEHPNNIPIIAVKQPQVLEVAGYMANICNNPIGSHAMTQTTSDASISSDTSTLTVRVGYDNTHYTDLMIYIHKNSLFDYTTNVIPINPLPRGITYQMKSISHNPFENVSLYFTKK